jgi:uncharacterized protein YjbI with pentapeptide repeats
MIRIFLALAFAVAPFAAASAENPTHVVSLKQTKACAGCDLSGAHLRVARIAGADLAGANLSDADLISADLGRTDLTGANLANANLIRASLVGANLTGARLEGANLTRTHIEDTDLSRVIGLTQAQLGLACGNANTRLPAGLSVKPCIGSEL